LEAEPLSKQSISFAEMDFFKRKGKGAVSEEQTTTPHKRKLEDDDSSGQSDDEFDEYLMASVEHPMAQVGTWHEIVSRLVTFTASADHTSKLSVWP
jgi:hypothetical protein